MAKIVGPIKAVLHHNLCFQCVGLIKTLDNLGFLLNQPLRFIRTKVTHWYFDRYWNSSKLLNQLGNALGSEKANGRWRKNCFGRVFNFKLGCLIKKCKKVHIQALSYLELKTQPRFSRYLPEQTLLGVWVKPNFIYPCGSRLCFDPRINLEIPSRIECVI
jgi:hypothetical protein